jgi:hypothetical protein
MVGIQTRSPISLEEKFAFWENILTYLGTDLINMYFRVSKEQHSREITFNDKRLT